MRFGDDSMDADAVSGGEVAFLFSAIKSRISRNSFASSLGSVGWLGSLAAANCLFWAAIVCNLLMSLTIPKSARDTTNKWIICWMNIP